jgi:hypothetical protein
MESFGQPTPTFHPGRMPELSPEQRRRRRRQQAAAARTAAKPSPVPFRPEPFWFLLPAAAVDPSVVIPICCAGRSLTAAVKKLEEYIKQKPIHPPGPPLPITLPLGYGRVSPEFIAAFREAIKQNMFVRTRMRRLAAAWVTKRLRAANEVDMVTCEAARQPVTLVDWPNRSTYTFEAQTILKDISSRLTLHDELWPTPQRPRNPYTNAALTLGQILHLKQQLAAVGKTHWSLEAFATSGYCFTTFARNFATPLKHSALNLIFREPSSDEYFYVMTEFIENEHDHHDQTYNAALYKWALLHEPDCQILMDWRVAARRYHELTLLHTDPVELRNHVDAEISPMTERLCGPPRVLQVLREQWHREQLLKAKQKNTLQAANGPASSSI